MRASRSGRDSVWMTIGELSEALGVTLRGLRHYETVGLLEPRRVNRRRFYGPRQQARAQAIADLRAVGVPLQQIAEALDETRDEDGRRKALAARLCADLDDLEFRVRRTQALLVALRSGAPIGLLPSDLSKTGGPISTGPIAGFGDPARPHRSAAFDED